MNNESTQIVFTGDIAFSKYYQNGWQNEGCLSAPLADVLRKADYVVANIESPVTETEVQSSNTLVHRSSPASGEYLNRMNIKVWNLANNHMMDCGEQGLADTIQCAEKNGCTAFGGGKNIGEASRPVILGDQVRIGVFSVAKPWKNVAAGKDKPGILTWDMLGPIRETIADLKKTADWIVINVHGGDEFCSMPMPYMRERYLALLDLGADFVIAHHPHVVQNYEKIGDKMIFYSLGNFIFDTENQRRFSHTDRGVLVKINFYKNRFQPEYIGFRNNRNDSFIEKSDIPPIFCEIDSMEYQKLWPLMAKYFYPVDFKKRKLFRKDYQHKSGFGILLSEIKLCRNVRERTIQKGRLLSVFGKWKSSKLKDVVRYIQAG